MNDIKSDVWDQHLKYHKKEEALLRPFLECFSVTRGERKSLLNTELSVYFLKPAEEMKERYGFEQEVLLVVSNYTTLEPRTIQAINAILNQPPAKGRVDQMAVYLVSEAENAIEWIKDYTAKNNETRCIIAAPSSRLRAAANDWLIRNLTSDQFYGRDLFDYRLPLREDIYFFGRETLLRRYVDDIRKGENRGLFGLRKTGKTSMLYKIERILQAEGKSKVIFLDCKSPSIRKLRWWELIERICKEISKGIGQNKRFMLTEKTAADAFEEMAAAIPQDQKFLIIFDEIEYISPYAIQDKHWTDDYIDFWQTFWATQSRERNISTLIAGVNASIIETSTFAKIQNPLFGIVSSNYLKGLEKEDLRLMLTSLGTRMGLFFDNSAIDYLASRYGGHPLLTRLCASHIHREFTARRLDRPLSITKGTLELEEKERDAAISFYCEHVISELRDFYQDEYTMLELLSSGQRIAFNEFKHGGVAISHLIEYGLVEATDGTSNIRIPAVGEYVAKKLAQKEGRSTVHALPEEKSRNYYNRQCIDMLMRDFRFLERLIDENKTPPIFGPNSFPEADKLKELEAVIDDKSLERFLNQMNRSLVESIEAHGKFIGQTDYFWSAIKLHYPSLFQALRRIKAYRNHHMHLRLNPKAATDLNDFVKVDFDSKPIGQLADGNFCVQFVIFENLISALQSEISRLQ